MVLETQTEHYIIYGNSQKISELADSSVDLVVTSPPYPMIEMWDQLFSEMDPRIRLYLDKGDGNSAFEAMNAQLALTWKEVKRVVKNGGFACINIGDATRKLGNTFRLYPSQSKITQFFFDNNFEVLPFVIWNKQTNSPNKFLGSGMLPAGAYVTLEHEYILVFRKKGKRVFQTDFEKQKRRESAYFWEERNIWFSEIWSDLKGVRQKMREGETRKRSGAFPFELAYRIINMYSVKGDLVLDPFLGTGTSILASIASERNSVGVEIDSNFKGIISERIMKAKTELNDYIQARIERHWDYIEEEIKEGKEMKYYNEHIKSKVKERTEQHIVFNKLWRIEELEKSKRYHAVYKGYDKNMDFQGEGGTLTEFV